MRRAPKSTGLTERRNQVLVHVTHMKTGPSRIASLNFLDIVSNFEISGACCCAFGALFDLASVAGLSSSARVAVLLLALLLGTALSASAVSLF